MLFVCLATNCRVDSAIAAFVHHEKGVDHVCVRVEIGKNIVSMGLEKANRSGMGLRMRAQSIDKMAHKHSVPYSVPGAR